VEKEIEKWESKIRQLTQDEEASATDYQKLMTIYEEKSAAQEALDALYLRWEALSED
jgi:DNA-binding SARP family transcriptional activator